MARTGRFVIKKTDKGYLFELQSSNYSAVAESPVYTTLDSAKRSIRSIIENAHSVPVQDNTVQDVVKYPNPKFEMSREGEIFSFRFRAGNGRLTISSQTYTTKEACRNGIESVQKNVSDAEICIETPDGIITIEEYYRLRLERERGMAESVGNPASSAAEDHAPASAAQASVPAQKKEEPAEDALSEDASRPGRFVIRRLGSGYMFELLAANYSAIAESPVYTTLDNAKRSIRSLRERAHDVPVQDNTLQDTEKKPNPKFEIFMEDDVYHFRFRAGNGRLTILSQKYSTKEACRNGILSVQRHVQNAEVFIETEDGTMPIDEYTAMRKALFTFNRRTSGTSETAEPKEMTATAEETAPSAKETPVSPVAEEPALPEQVKEDPVGQPVEKAPVEQKTEETPVASSVSEQKREEKPAASSVPEQKPEEMPPEQTSVESKGEKAPVEELVGKPNTEKDAADVPATDGKEKQKKKKNLFMRFLFGD